MQLRLEHYSYRFAEQVLNSRLAIKQEVETVLTDPTTDLSSLSRPGFNALLDRRFAALGWETQPQVFGADEDASSRMDFLKDRIGIEVEFGHPSFLGIDLLKFQVASYSSMDKIDVGVYVTTTRHFQRLIQEEYGQKWNGSINYERVVRYLPLLKSAIQVPVYVLGIDVS